MSSTTTTTGGASAPPTFRSACENCHRRKMRCIMSPDNPACHNCSASGTQCLFAPRAKAGRPRRSESSQTNSRSPKSNAANSSSSVPPQTTISAAPSPNAAQRSQSEQWHKRKGSPIQQQLQQQHNRTQSEPMNVFHPLQHDQQQQQQQQQQQVPQSWIPGMDQNAFLKHQPLPQTVEEESMSIDPSCMLSEEDMSSFINMASFDQNGYLPSDPFMMRVFSNEPDPTDPMQMQPPPMMPMLSSHGSGFDPMPAMGPDMDLAMNMGILTPPSSSAASISSMDVPTESSLSFNEILKLCESLEQRRQMFQDPSYEVQDIPNVFNMIESVCRIAVETNPASMDQAGASAALVLANLHKYIELCWSIVKHFSAKTKQAQEAEALNHLLLLKRLDITLLQAKHAFSRMSQPAGGKKALQVHQYIENVVKQQYQSWLW